MTIVGFTGSRLGMTDSQIKRVREILSFVNATKGQHGDCLGSDAQFNDICLDMGIYTIGHPGYDYTKKSPYRAYCVVGHSELPLPYLQRNRIIIDTSDVIIATPRGSERVRSGTWSTVRYAMQKNKDLYVVQEELLLSTV